jgi:CubicO group peptidase (beta-lactamase class C family)
MTRRAALVSGGTGALGLLAMSVGCRGNGNSAGSTTTAGATPKVASTGTGSATPTTGATSTRQTTTPSGSVYFPPPTGDVWEALNATDNGWDDARLADVATYCGDHNSTSLLITQDGRIVLEQYWNNTSRHTATDVFSAQKSIVSLLTGIAADEKLLDIEKPVATYLGGGWTKSPASEARITVRHLLTMTSGLTDDLSFEAEPGTLWRYNTNAFQMLHSVIGHAANTTMEDWTASKLGQQIGWQDASWRDRAKLKLPDGTPQRGLQLSARDAARFGLLTLRSGKWDDKQVVSTNYVGEALTSSTTLNPAYGLLWWLNGKQSYMVPGSSKSRPGPLIPPAPTDLVAAMGALDQRIYIVPSRQWVIVRQGRQANTGEAGAEALSGFDTDFFTRLMAAAPK